MLRKEKHLIDQKKLTRLNILFEKVVSDKANLNERRELKSLYHEYIDDKKATERCNLQAAAPAAELLELEDSMAR